MDKKLMQRLAAIKAKASAADPKSIDSMTDAVGTEDPEIQKLVEKIMSKMDAKDGAGKYSVAAQRKAAVAHAFALVKKAFGEDPMAAPMPPPAPAGPPDLSPMDAAMGETPGGEAAEGSVPELAPVQALETEAKTFGDPALDALVNVIELLIKKDMGKDSDMEDDTNPSGPPQFAPGDDGEDDDAAPAADAPPAFGDDAAADDDGGDDAAAPSFPPKKKSSESKDDKSGDEDKSEDDDKDEDDSSDDADKKEKPEQIEAEATLYLLHRKIDAAKSELTAVNRVRAIAAMPKAARLEKAAQFRKMADWMEDADKGADEPKADSPEDETMDKSALKNALNAVLAALEAGENDQEYVAKADPEEEHAEAEKLSKDASLDGRKARVLAHLAQLRMSKEANVYGKEMATPKEVPSPSGSVEDNLKGDAKVQYQNALGSENLGIIQDKKQKLPTDPISAGEAKEIFHGNNPEAAQHPQTEKDSSKDVNNKRHLSDMETAVQAAVPTVGDDGLEKGSGSHQKEKTWDKAKSESDITPSGGRLVGLASAIKLARLAESKGLIAAAQYDEQVMKYASYDEEKFNIVAELVNDAPARGSRRTASDGVFEDYAAVEDAEEASPETPSDKLDLGVKASKAVRRIQTAASSAGITRPLTLNDSSTRGGNTRVAALNGLWSLGDAGAANEIDAD